MGSLTRLPEGAEELLRAKTFAHLAVLVEGAPHVSPVWVDVRDGRILVNTAEGRVKARALVDGASVALSATDPENPYRALTIRGRVVERTHEGADADIDALAKKYLGQDTYPYRQPGEQRVTVLIEPEKVSVR